ncbi:hypothetical protein IFR05_001703 [Cadophora sp. M221]|nr:hypothetical protein IFR05_001703 [Cadophora sp. M221]
MPLNEWQLAVIERLWLKEERLAAEAANAAEQTLPSASSPGQQTTGVSKEHVQPKMIKPTLPRPSRAIKPPIRPLATAPIVTQSSPAIKPLVQRKALFTMSSPTYQTSIPTKEYVQTTERPDSGSWLSRPSPKPHRPTLLASSEAHTTPSPVMTSVQNTQLPVTAPAASESSADISSLTRGPPGAKVSKARLERSVPKLITEYSDGIEWRYVPPAKAMQNHLRSVADYCGIKHDPHSNANTLKNVEAIVNSCSWDSRPEFLLWGELVQTSSPRAALSTRAPRKPRNLLI